MGSYYVYRAFNVSFVSCNFNQYYDFINHENKKDISMYKVIICAIEASSEGKEVLSKAYNLAQLFNSELYVTNVIPYTLLPKDYQKELQENVSPEIESITQSLGIPKGNVTVKFGKPYEQICSLAENKKADLIILGTHSKKGLNALIGSTANAVANYAKCDVSLIKI